MERRAVTLDHSGERVTHVASPPSREDLENALTEAKRVDPDLRRIIDTIPVLAWCNLPDGSVEFANQRWHDYTGLSPEGTRGWGWMVAIHADDLETMTGKWQALLASGQTARSKHACAVTTENIDGSCSGQSPCATITATSSNGMARIPISRIVSAPRHYWPQKPGPWK